jgi:hypothetical protein
MVISIQQIQAAHNLFMNVNVKYLDQRGVKRQEV